MITAIIGPYPPPYHGAGKNTAKIAALVASLGGRHIPLNTNPEGAIAHSKDIRFLVRKGLKTLYNCTKLRKCSTFYLVPDGGNGVLFSLLYALACYTFGIKKVYFHHRNYSHIYKRSNAMRIITRLHPKSTHIFLTDGMASEFSKKYSNCHAKLIVSNEALCDTSFIDGQSGTDRYPTVGYLSNLTPEKGYYDVLETFVRLSEEDSLLTFHLAGEPVGHDELNALKQAQAILGDRLVYWGSVSGSTKQKFFEGVDIFVFPTRYPLEAQPNVIIEATACGCFVIASNRACIPEMLEEIPSRCIRESRNMSDDLSIAVLNAVPIINKSLKNKIVRGALIKREQAKTSLENLVLALM